MQIVNGYVCRTCCDVDAAKAGKDPAHPNAPPGSTDKPGQSNKSGQTTAPSPPAAPAYSGALVDLSA